MECKILKQIAESHKLWLDSDRKFGARADFEHCDLRGQKFGGMNLAKANFRGANLRFATFKGTNLWGCDFHHANLEDADLTGATIDYASLPISCGLLRVRVDKKIFCQFAYHLCSMVCDDEEVIEAQNYLLKLANQFCRVQDGELPEIETR